MVINNRLSGILFALEYNLEALVRRLFPRGWVHVTFVSLSVCVCVCSAS